MRSTLLVLALLPLPVLSCSDSDGPADDPALPAATERVLLTDQSTWTSVAAAGDPFGAPDPGEEVCDDPSELMAEVFGPENGVGSRSAVGMGSLPGNIAVEIEAVFEIAEE